MKVFTANYRLPDVARGKPFLVEVDGEMIEAFVGETVAAVLIACGKRVFRHDEDSAPGGVFCGIGQCFSCQVTIDDQTSIRACMTAVSAGMKIYTSGRTIERGNDRSRV